MLCLFSLFPFSGFVFPELLDPFELIVERPVLLGSRFFFNLFFFLILNFNCFALLFLFFLRLYSLSFNLLEQLLVELILLLFDLLWSKLFFSLEVVLARLLDLVPGYALLIELSLPKHLVDMVRVTLQVATDEVLAHKRVIH